MRSQLYLLTLTVFLGLHFIPPAGAETSRTERLLRSSQFYSVPDGVETLDHLGSLVQILHADLIRHPEDHDTSHLMLGDLYHWLGHLHEERSQLHSAYEFYTLSLENYAKTSIQHSRFIANYFTLDHARYHLVMISRRLNQSTDLTLTGPPRRPIADDDLQLLRYRINLNHVIARSTCASRL